jgi:hypothetical protein
MRVIMGFSSAAKAWLGAAAALAGFLIGVLDPQAVGLAAFVKVTTVQWLGAFLTVLGSWGIVYAVPNRPEPLAIVELHDDSGIGVIEVLVIIALVLAIIWLWRAVV